MIRAFIVSVLEGVIKRFSAESARGALQDRELFQHYGFTSRPLTGAEAIVMTDGNIHISVAEDDRRYRLAIEPGEVALYTDEGDSIRLRRGGIIELSAATKVRITAPALEVAGDLTVEGDVADEHGSMAAMRQTYNSHTHSNPEGGVTGVPVPIME